MVSKLQDPPPAKRAERKAAIARLRAAAAKRYEVERQIEALRAEVDDIEVDAIGHARELPLTWEEIREGLGRSTSANNLRTQYSKALAHWRAARSVQSSAGPGT